MARKSDIQILRVTMSALDLVIPLFDAYREFYEQPSDTDGARIYLMDRIRLKQSAIFLAIDANTEEAIGFTQLYPSFSSVSLKPVWILYDLYVAQNHRRKGIGKALMEHAHLFARESGAKSVSLATAIDNYAGQKLYESLGYQRDNGFYYYDLLL